MPAPTAGPEIQHGPATVQRALIADALGPDFIVRVMRGDGPGIATEVRLRDGTWARFAIRPARERFRWPGRLLRDLGVLLACALLLSLLAVRWVTRPLGVLARAAEELGKDIQRPPLAEDGPEEVQRAARAFNTMQSRLAGHIADRTRVLAAVSHDLKTPLTRMRLRVEALDDEALKSKFVHDLDEMRTMVDGTLAFVRGTERTEATQRIDVDALVASLAEDARELGHVVSVSGSANVPYAGRAQSLKRCLANLLDNAAQYGGAAEIDVEDDARELRIRIRDRGPGIPAAELERVFEPFYRLEASRSRETGGSGLGLAIARNVAVAHGGSLTLANRAAGGLDALLALPR